MKMNYQLCNILTKIIAGHTLEMHTILFSELEHTISCLKNFEFVNTLINIHKLHL